MPRGKAESTLEIMEKSYLSVTADRAISRASVDLERNIAKALIIKPEVFSQMPKRHESVRPGVLTHFLTPKHAPARRKGPARLTPQPADPPAPSVTRKNEIPEKVSCYPFSLTGFQDFKMPMRRKTDKESFLTGLSRLASGLGG